MPGTVLKGQLSSIEEKLSASLGGTKSSSEDLGRKLASQSRSILLQKITFVPAVHESGSYWNQVAQKYSGKVAMNINLQKGCVLNGVHKKVQKVSDADGLPPPKIVLYDKGRLHLTWRNGARKGCGLQNTHNTCFMNSVLQALTYTPAFNNYLASKEHSSNCENRGLCMICVMEEHIRAVATRNIWTPWAVIKNLRSIAKHFSHGRQEDAHEFLRYFVEAMTKSALLQHAKLDVYSKNTTALHQIFGGYLRSQVKCLNCDHKSNTYDPMLDLALDIKDASNLTQALESFTKPESLHGENCYSCERCKKKVKAIKRFSIHQPPNVLTIQLKRFDMTKLHSKVNKPVNFPPKLDLRNFMSNKQGKPVIYTLYAVLVHSGACASFGHYYTYAKVPSGQWCLFNDSHVSPSSIESVLRQQAYILFYSKQVQSVTSHVTPQSPFIGPVKKAQVNTNQQYGMANGVIGKQNGGLGTPIPRKIPPSATAPKPPTPVPTSPVKSATPVPQSLHVNKVNTVQPASVQPTNIVSAKERQKISFGIKPKSDKTDSTKPTPVVPLVMKIKDGKVVSNTASPPDTSKNTIFSPGSLTKSVNGEVRRRLVPYNEDNTSSSDNEVEAINGSNGHKTPPKNGLSNGENITKAAAKTVTNGQTDPKIVRPKPMFSNNQGKKEVKAKESPIKSKDAAHFEPILDERLKTTTEVPGSYGPLDRLQSNGFKTPPFRTLDRKELTLNLSSPEPGKLNSTSKWAIVEQEQKSPSLASSTSSVNSTSEWKVREETPKKSTSTPHVPAASPVGWNVTPIPMAIVKNIHCSQDLPSSSTISAAPLPEVQTNHVRGSTANQSSEKSGHSPRQQLFSGNGQAPNQVLSGTQNDVSTVEPSINPGHMNGSDVNTSYDTSSESQISGDTSSSTSSQKKKKKKKKERQEAEAGAASVYDFNEPDQHTHGERKKKKKKKKKHKHREYEPGELSDSPEPRKRSHEENSQVQSKRMKEDFEWVERTKETIEKESLSKPVPVTQWDQSKKDVHRNRSWDGIRNDKSDVLAHLQQSSLQGYGPQVNSWDGGLSTLDQDFAKDKKNLKRSWEDEYEEQLDMGKMKKVKKPREDSRSGDNLFQKFQDQLHQPRPGHYKERNSEFQSPARGSDHNHHGHSTNYRGNNDHYRGNQRNFRGKQHNHYGNQNRNDHHHHHHYHSNNRQSFGNHFYRKEGGFHGNRNDQYRGQNSGGYNKPWRGGGYSKRGGHNNRFNQPYYNNNHGYQRNQQYRY